MLSNIISYHIHYYQLLSFTIYYYLSLSITIYYYLLLSITIYYCLSLYITACYYISLFITSYYYILLYIYIIGGGRTCGVRERGRRARRPIHIHLSIHPSIYLSMRLSISIYLFTPIYRSIYIYPLSIDLHEYIDGGACTCGARGRGRRDVPGPVVPLALEHCI